MHRNAIANADTYTGNGSPATEAHAPTGSRSPVSADIHPGVGFRVKRDFPRPSYDVATMFQDFEIAEISDHLNRLYALDSSIRCLSGGDRRLAGPACTVKVYPGDNLMVHKALDLAKPGDVVVVDARGSMENAVLGDTISMKARHRGILGFVVDGYVRDLIAIQDLNYPVYARGNMPIGPLHRGPGEINYPVCCGGVVVEPGDFIIADLSGTVVLPQACVEELHERLRRYKERSAIYMENVRNGKFSNAWVDQLLEKAQCPCAD
ncbi:MAG TPA: RraA family protein [Candidatus Binataceae bacterium]|nr:RraA family protein [Candidatus Binataceae bacterium]